MVYFLLMINFHVSLRMIDITNKNILILSGIKSQSYFDILKFEYLKNIRDWL